jgi:hypothetical protein
VSVADTSALLGRRVCAALAVGSAALHAISLGHAVSAASGVLMGAMIAGCVYCARDLWVRGTLRAWVLVALMNLAMIAVHVGVPAHHHGAVAASTVAVHESMVMTLATALAAVEVLLAAGVVYHRTRRIAPTGTKLDATAWATRTFPA